MIKPTISIRGKIKESINIKGKTNLSIIKEYPELENVEITPTLEDQTFKPEKYGFKEVKVKGVQAYIDEDIKPEYIKGGVDILGVIGNVVELQGEEKTIVPSISQQVILPSEDKNGMTKIIVEAVDNTIDEDIKPENIVDGVEILGVVGNYKGIDTSDATVSPSDVLEGKTVYINNQKIVGTLPNNGELAFDPSDEEQQVPEGYTSGGLIKSADITKLNEYEACLTLANSIETSKDYADTTATPKDLIKGKTAYSNGERIIGELEIASNEELETSFVSSIDNSLGANVTKLPDSLTSIAPYAFYGCTNLTLTELPSKITTIGSRAFNNCSQLDITEIPDSVTTIETYAFYGCLNMELTKISSQLQQIDSYCFQNCSKLALTELPDNIRNISVYAFSGCTNLPLEKLPSKLTNMETYAFYNCTNLKITEIPSGLKSIPSYGFANCKSLTEITFEGNVRTISANSFNGCTNLFKIVLPNVTKSPSLSSKSAFSNTAIANGTGYIYVPDDLIDTFKSASNWSVYANQIKGVSELV